MRTAIASGLAGLIFGLGLALAGMTDADKVIGFLDLADAWDPSLAFVMGGAIGVHLLVYRAILARPGPLFGGSFGIPTRSDLDARLVVGSGLFGVGWAIGGYCPGPGLVSAAAGSPNALVFAASMTGGMLLFHVYDEIVRTRQAEEARTDPVGDLHGDAAHTR